MTYSEIKAEIEAAPKTYLPGLLVAVVKTLTTKKVLKPGGAARIAQNVEDEMNGEPESVDSGSPAATGSAATCQWEEASPPSICGKPAEYEDASGKKLCKRHGEYIKNRWPESVTKLMPLNEKS